MCVLGLNNQEKLKNQTFFFRIWDFGDHLVLEGREKKKNPALCKNHLITHNRGLFWPSMSSEQRYSTQMSKKHFLSVGSFIIQLVLKTELFNTTAPERLLPRRGEGTIREKCGAAQQTAHTETYS